MDAIDSSGLVIPVSVWVKKLPSSSSVNEPPDVGDPPEGGTDTSTWEAPTPGGMNQSEPRCLVVMEPVERTTANVTFDSSVSIPQNIMLNKKGRGTKRVHGHACLQFE